MNHPGTMNHRGDTTVIRCPTCRAVQEWSDVCRRCKCELRLLEAAALTSRRARRRCLEALLAGRRAEALRLAKRCHWLQPGPESRRLLALCALLAGDWAGALELEKRCREPF